MVLMDAEGGRINASIMKTLLYKFKNEILEGKIYIFENLCVAINGDSYKTTQLFISLAYIVIDVIGLLFGLGNEREIRENGTTTNLNVIELEVDGYILK
ncbi:hypothetical protein RYX36_009128 [Vicia faba]